MSAQSRISKAFENALELPHSSNSRYILFSDCHRGVGNANDNFLKNEAIYLAAMEYYFQRGFTYLELGDGDELWENRSLERIREMHPDSFEMIEKFAENGRMFCIYGNHDMVNRKGLHESIVLRDISKEGDIYLLHGHQASIWNSTFWKCSRFLVRYVWKPLEGLGIPDPTSAAKNHRRKRTVEKHLLEWAKRHEKVLIAGHTHRPMLGSKKSPYYNTGSCVHPCGITGIEVVGQNISLVKWSVRAREDLSLYVTREVLGSDVLIGF